MWCGMFAAGLVVLIGALITLLVRERMVLVDLREEASVAWDLAEIRRNEMTSARTASQELAVEYETQIGSLKRQIGTHLDSAKRWEKDAWHWKERADRAETALRVAAANVNAEISRLAKALEAEKVSA